MLDNLTQSVIENYSRTDIKSISQKEKHVLRELALEVFDYSVRSQEIEKRNLWYDHNELKPTRPLITMEPENSWNELISREEILCENFIARVWEEDLRKLIYCAKYFKDDRVIEAVIYVPILYKEFDFGLKSKIIESSSKNGSYTWEAPLRDYENDLKYMHFPELDVDLLKTEEIVNAAREIFADLITIKTRGIWWWTLGLTWRYSSFRGLEQLMFDFYDYPNEVHSTMDFLCNSYLHLIDEIEKRNLFTLNNGGTYLGSGGFGYSRELPNENFNGIVRTKDMWGFAEAQEVLSVSPEMFDEFIFPYQIKLLSRFGLNYYGCCEPLNNRWDTIKNIPRLRRVSVSPWSNLEDMAEKLGPNYILSMKASPMDLAVTNIDKAKIRNDLRHNIKILKNCRAEITMQDTHTICNNPNNAIDWCKIAMEEAINS